ncbi:unnamed protein product, partial [Musa acuminata subsp. burmannicoides]
WAAAGITVGARRTRASPSTTRKRWHVVTGKGLCAIMWFWILYRAKQDGPVVLGWRHPWEGHGDHSHGHGHEHEVLLCNLLLKFV